jgi:hypothetical protein
MRDKGRNPRSKGDSSKDPPIIFPKNIMIGTCNLKREGSEATYPYVMQCLARVALWPLLNDLEYLRQISLLYQSMKEVPCPNGTYIF